MSQDNPHAKHRQRLREKIKRSGIKALAEHEVLEWLLTYTIPRKNTNPIGHELIKKFGSLSHVLEATFSDLIKVEGVGPESALFLSSILPVLDEYQKSKSKQMSKTLPNRAAAIEYYRQNTIIRHNEIFSVMCLNSKNKLIKMCNVLGKDGSSIKCGSKEIFDELNVPNVKRVILFHTHPNGEVIPSKEDIETTHEIINMCKYVNIAVVDHVILNESQHYSFYANGLIQQLEDLINKKLDIASITIKNIVESIK